MPQLGTVPIHAAEPDPIRCYRPCMPSTQKYQKDAAPSLKLITVEEAPPFRDAFPRSAAQWGGGFWRLRGRSHD